MATHVDKSTANTERDIHWTKPFNAWVYGNGRLIAKISLFVFGRRVLGHAREFWPAWVYMATRFKGIDKQGAHAQFN